ncbi:MAG: ChaB family protein [Chloroflexi bacterium]|nr:ChaB family protein [Chloroflexota bacterium]
MANGILKAPGLLPLAAQEIWLREYSIARDGLCRGGDAEQRESCASETAWQFVRRDFRKVNNGLWTPR